VLEEAAKRNALDDAPQQLDDIARKLELAREGLSTAWQEMSRR